MTKAETHNYIKFNAHLDKDSYSKPELYGKKKKEKPTLAESNGNISKYKKAVRAFYKDRDDN